MSEMALFSVFGSMGIVVALCELARSVDIFSFFSFNKIIFYLFLGWPILALNPNWNQAMESRLSKAIFCIILNCIIF